MKNLRITIFTALLLNSSVFASVSTAQVTKVNPSPIEQKFRKNLSKKEMMVLRDEIINLKGKSVSSLIKVMKDKTFPDKNRWMATFLLGQVMGKKSAPFISKFSTHPDWIMRMASLKTLAALKQVQYKDIYKKLLQDSSMLVRYQALETVKTLSLNELAPNVWAMLYDKKNYHVSDKTKGSKRTHIIKNVIMTVGELNFEKAKEPLLSMMQKEKYKDIHVEIDLALQKLYSKKSPDGSIKLKKNFWKKIQIANTII